MNQRLIVAVGTVLVFGAGFGAGLWREHHRPLPPPPGPFGWEFSRGHPPSMSSGPRRDHPLNRADLIAQVESLRPQLEAFHAKLDAIDAQFNQDLDPILTPEERARHDEHVKHVHYGREQKDEGRPVSDDRLTYLLREQPAQTVLWEVIIPLRLDALVNEYKLDEGQREKVRELLKVRRTKVLELVDSSPPPTVILYRLIPLVQRLEHSGSGWGPKSDGK